MPALSFGAPTGGVVTSGSAAISQSGTVTNITQGSQKATINWQGFSIAGNETVNFNQPNSSAITLNRVVGNERSVINGAMNANGQVFLINSNGVLFGQGSSINVGGLVASSLNITDEDFNAGNYVFKGNGGSGSILNLGTITAKDGGYVALFGNNVSNQGLIAATKGTVALSAGEQISLNFNGDSLLSVTIDQGALNALVDNQQAIVADGGTVFLTAKAVDDLLGAQVNNSGIIQARTIDDLTGKIELFAHGGTANVAGTLDASAPTSGDGGFIETSGDQVQIADGAVITTKSEDGQSGTWLIDPTNFTISSGSGAQTTSGIGAVTLSNNLNNNGNVSIVTAAGGSEEGDINVNAAVAWSSGSKLTLTAADDININAAISASNGSLELNAGSGAGNDININAPITLGGASSQLVMNYGGDYYIRTKASYSGTVTDATGNPVAKIDTSSGVYGSITFTNSANTNGLLINGDTYTLIHSVADLDALDGYDAANSTGAASAVNGFYALAGDLSASGTAYSTALISTFSGTLAGLGHVVDGVTINTSDSSVGLIGQTAASATTLRDIGVTNFSLSTTGSGEYYGALLGTSNSANLFVSNAYSTGNIDTYSGIYVGGLIGATSNSGYSKILDAFSSINLTASLYGGGLLGYAGGSTGASAYYTSLNNVHASGNVTAKSSAYASGQKLGGLVGAFSGHGSIANAYATGHVESHMAMLDAYTEFAGSHVGGLVGSFDAADAYYTNSVTNAFATGDVIGGYNVGGLIGYLQGASASYFTVNNAYATGSVTATATSGTASNVGGLIGYASYLNISNSHATGAVVQAITEGRFVGLTTNMASNVGGLVGYGANTNISNAYSTSSVSASSLASNVGGLAGSVTTITDSYATGAVTGLSNVGGLVGTVTTVTNSHATGNVTGSGNNVGGLAGGAELIKGSYATGNVSGFDYVGGLLGGNTVATITDSYATGNASGRNYIGGLAGAVQKIENSWVSGSVSGVAYTGALVGQITNKGSITNSYWDTSKNTQSNPYGWISGRSATKEVTVQNSEGLSGSSSADIAYYANGTIDQVLADRATAAAQQQAYQQSATQIASNETSRTLNPPAPAPVETQFDGFSPGAMLDQAIVFADNRSFSTDIRRIEVDGQVFYLEDEGEGAGKSISR